MGDMLSQDEINALLGGHGVGVDAPSDQDQLDETASQVSRDSLTSEQKDILGEIGNISMGTSATTLFALLNQRVNINTPHVQVKSWKEVAASYDRPCVGIRVDYKEGLRGANILILKQHDVKIITSLMMGGDGTVDPDAELTEIDLSAIGEAMNQMVGSSATSISSMMHMKIDIDTPRAFVLDFNNDDFFRDVEFAPDEVVACVSFRMQIGTLIDSTIMQIIPQDFAIEMVETLKNELMPDAPAQSQPAPAPIPPAQTPIAPPPIVQAPMAQAPVAPAPTPSYVAPPPQMERQPMDQPYMQPQAQYAPPPQQYAPPQQQYAPQFTPPPVNVQPVQFQNFDVNAVMQQKENIDIIMDVPLEVTVELGRTHKKIKEILEFGPGTVVELDKLAGDPVDILVNGKFVAKGEVVVIDENFGIRITDIISPENRI